jgi:hypothetical protein
MDALLIDEPGVGIYRLVGLFFLFGGGLLIEGALAGVVDAFD